MITHSPSQGHIAAGTPRRPLSLKRLGSDEVDFINAIRHAADTDLSCLEPGTVLQWRPCMPGDESGMGTTMPQAAVALQGDSGELLLEDGAVFVQALTGIPLHAQVEPAQRQWLRCTAAALLPPPLGAVFNAIGQPVGEGRAAGNTPRLKARLLLRTADHVVTTHGSAPWAVWRRLLAKAGPRSNPGAGPLAWQGVRVRHPVLVGRHWLSAARLKSLGPGDIVLPRQPLFEVSGRGSVRLGPWQVDVQSGAGHVLEVVAVYSSADRQTTNDWDGRETPGDGFPGGHDEGLWDGDDGEAHPGHDAAAPGHAPTGTPALEPLSALQVPLQFELGAVSLSLAEMQGLAPGSVLRLQSPASPPHVVVRAGGKVVGQGELVDVDGRLGIQLTAWAGP